MVNESAGNSAGNLTSNRMNSSDTNSDAKLFRLELFIAKFLRYGVLVAGLLIFIAG